MKTNRKLSFSYSKLIIVLILLGLGSCTSTNFNDEPKADLKVVRFGMLPYGDHTYAIIGAKQNWFNEVGIDLQYQPIKIEAIIPSLKNKTLDVSSCSPGILFSSYDNAQNLCSFVFGDIFQGYAIMAQPNSGYKSYSEFIAQGNSIQDAIIATVKQLKNKTFAFPSETAIKPFIDIVLEKGNLSRNDFKSSVLDDPLTVNAMRNKQADFQVGGVPSRIVLQREGFIPIISSIDIVKAANPSPDSKELASVFPDGWATTKEYFEKEHATILRLASVNFRIMKFMKEDQEAALKIHMPYLTQVTGQSFTIEEGKIIYDFLDPFITFEEQLEWYHNPSNPLFYKNVNGSALNSFIEQKAFKKNPPTVDDIIYADDVYFELEKLKASSDSLFRIIESKNMVGNNEKLTTKFSDAKKHYEIYNYFDSDRIAKKIIEDFSK